MSFFILIGCALILFCVGMTICYAIIISNNICELFNKTKQSITIYGSLGNLYLNIDNDIKLEDLNNFKVGIVIVNDDNITNIY